MRKGGWLAHAFHKIHRHRLTLPPKQYLHVTAECATSNSNRIPDGASKFNAHQFSRNVKYWSAMAT
jgi:hypothetical protein